MPWPSCFTLTKEQFNRVQRLSMSPNCKLFFPQVIRFGNTCTQKKKIPPLYCELGSGGGLMTVG